MSLVYKNCVVIFGFLSIDPALFGFESHSKYCVFAYPNEKSDRIICAAGWIDQKCPQNFSDFRIRF